MRLLLVGLVVAAGVSAGFAAASDAGDVRTARALVLARADVPSYWTAVRIPCASVRHPDVRVSARATSGWAGTRLGTWSVAHVTGTVAQARALYEQIVATLPTCVARFWRSHTSPPNAEQPEVRTAAAEVVRLADEQMRWRITVTPQVKDQNPGQYDVVVVRKDRSVAQYVYSWVDGISAIRRALRRV